MAPLPNVQNEIVNDETVSINRAIECLKTRQVINTGDIRSLQVKLTQFDETFWEIQNFKENVIRIASNSLSNEKLIDKLERDINNIKELIINHRVRINEELSKQAKRIKISQDDISSLQIREGNSFLFEEDIESRVKNLEVRNRIILFFLLISFLYIFFN